MATCGTVLKKIRSKTMTLPFLVILLPGWLSAQDPSIRLITGTIQPPPGIETSLLEEMVEIADSSRIRVLLQFDSPLKDEDYRLLENYAVRLQGYVPDLAFVATLPMQNLNAIRNDSDLPIRWIGNWDENRSIHPSLRLPRPENTSGEYIHAALFVLKETSLDDAVRRVSLMGGTTVAQLRGPHALEIWLPESRLSQLAGDSGIALMVSPPSPPLTPNLDDARRHMNAEALASAPYNLQGSGVEVFVYDSGLAVTHPGFSSRLTILTGETAATSNHSTHVTGIVGGDGSGGNPPIGRDVRGLASAADLLTGANTQIHMTEYFYSNSGDLEADYISAHQNHDFDLSNNSIGTNVANNGFDCALQGAYGLTAAAIDSIARGDHPNIPRPAIIVWAAGNERTGGVPTGRCGAGYDTISPPSSAKNPIHVGALFSDASAMTFFSSWGPTNDGRLKPLVVGPGCETGVVNGESGIMSTVNVSNNYNILCGTSMSAPAVAGLIALGVEQWRITHVSNARPHPALVKAWLMQTSRDLGEPGPDYIFGYGTVDGKALIDLIKNPAKYHTSALDNTSDFLDFPVQVPLGAHYLKASLAWDDPAAAAFSAGALVNDLDLTMIAPDGTVYGAFVNDPMNPGTPAVLGTNVLDNQEQSLVDRPMAGSWTVRVRANNLPGGSQLFGLAITAPNLPKHESDVFATETFDSGLGSWVTDGALVADPSGRPGQAVKLGDANSVDQGLYLELTLPNDAEDLVLNYEWYMTSDEPANAQGDVFTGRIRTPLNNTIGLFDVRTENWQRGVWMKSGDVSIQEFAGQTIRIFFRGFINGSNPTRFYIDNVRLRRCDTAQSADLAITAAPSAPTAEPGNPITYTLTLQNNGMGDAQNAAALVTFPPNAALQSTDCGSPLTNPLYWDAGDLASGNMTDCTVTVNLNNEPGCLTDIQALIGGDWLETVPLDNTFQGAGVTLTPVLEPILPDWPAVRQIDNLIRFLNCTP